MRLRGGGWSSAAISQTDAAEGQELPSVLSTPRDPRPVQEAAVRWGVGGRGLYQQQVLHLVLSFVASRGLDLKRKGKGAV